MIDRPFLAVVSSGSLRLQSPKGVEFSHSWTQSGVVVESEFTGGHLIHLAIAGCVLNDVHREAVKLGITIDGVKVVAWGDFDRSSWQSTGVEYSVEIDAREPDTDLDRLLAIVDDVAEMPKTLRLGTTVTRV